MLTFSIKYFSITVLIFAIETLIALFVNDNFIRPYLGDLLIVILLYCFVKSFLNLPVLTAAILVLIFSFLIEFLQLINLVHKLHLENSKIAITIIGTSFSWIDLLMYSVGIAIILIIEKARPYFSN